MDHLTPEPGGLQHVRLVHADNSAGALLCGGHGNPGNALNLHDRISLRVIGLRAERAVSSAAFTEVDTAGQLPDDQQVKSVFHRVRVEKALADQGGIELGRTEIGVKPHGLPDAEEAFFRANLSRQIVPFRSADSTQQNGICSQTPVQRFLRQGDARFINGDSAQQIFSEAERMPVFLSNLLQDLNGTVDDFRPDAISLEKRNGKVHACPSLFAFCLSRR